MLRRFIRPCSAPLLIPPARVRFKANTAKVSAVPRPVRRQTGKLKIAAPFNLPTPLTPQTLCKLNSVSAFASTFTACSVTAL
jgi:hypothetical protein